MLDTKSNLVLKVLQKECKNGGYKIIDKNDVISALPSKYRCDIDELDHITSYLERQDLISIKYDDDSVYCLCVLPFANEIFETETKKKRNNFLFLIPLLALILSFVGAFLGSLAAKFF